MWNTVSSPPRRGLFNNGRKSVTLNLIELNCLSLHPSMKLHTLFYKGMAISDTIFQVLLILKSILATSVPFSILSG